MGYLEALLLGVVQGLTEFLPISSSAHLRVVGGLLGTDPGASFTAVTQLGTETAVVLYFARDIWRIVRSWSLSLVGRVPRDDPDARTGWLIIVGSVPIGVLGFLLQDLIRDEARSLWLVATTLWVFALVLWWADRRAADAKPLTELSWRDGILFGLAQALALVPGVSRSGGTITAGLLLGYTRAAAARYSFLLAIPAVFGSGLYELQQIGEEGTPVAWGPTLLATVVALGVALVAIHWFLRWISSRGFGLFVAYRIGLAALIYVLLLTGALQA
ncbi:undecaprenyl-diphosphate phosphatase [Aquipuribacter nitratireducens]|uniref:Undecaprenyl-diphosphatase n=1 Tax=Aquipuribacter nitratireducens TaxID=650104 RepID=A0ABW0GIF9_9MICO